MDLYGVALFLHILGAAVVFGGYGALLFVLVALRAAKTTQEVRALTRMLHFRKLGFEYLSVIDLGVIAGGALLAIAGLSMAIGTWHMAQAWIWVSMPAVLLIGVLGAFVVSPRLHRVAMAAMVQGDGPLTRSLQRQVNDVVPTAIVRAGLAGLVAIIFLMTNKPSLFGGSVIVCTSMCLAAISARVWRPKS